MFIEAVKVSDAEEVRRALASAVTSCHAGKLGAGAGFEPAMHLLELILQKMLEILLSNSGTTGGT
jgi:hypothetical protein